MLFSWLPSSQDENPGTVYNILKGFLPHLRSDRGDFPNLITDKGIGIPNFSLLTKMRFPGTGERIPFPEQTEGVCGGNGGTGVVGR